MRPINLNSSQSKVESTRLLIHKAQFLPNHCKLTTQEDDQAN